MNGSIRLHYAAQDHRIGDVHPYYDEKTETWYMYYLKPDGFSSALLTSKDLLAWEPAPLAHAGGKLANYYVLGVIADGEQYRSWFGYGSTMASTVSDDLLTYENAAYAYTIPLDMARYPSGARDPFVFFDPVDNVYRVICTAYRTNQLQNKGKGMECMLAVGSTTGSSLDQWGKIDTTLLFFDGLVGEPECSQVFWINDRWYVFASMARRHPNHVGRLSYWIGEAGKGLLDQDWTTHEEQFLTGEDLCAAQLAPKGDALYLWGWIAQDWQGGVWGGHLSLPLTVTQGKDGVLLTAPAPEVADAVRGVLLAQDQGPSPTVIGTFAAYDASFDLTFAPGASPELDLGPATVRWNLSESRLEIIGTAGQVHTTLPLPDEAFEGRHQARVLAQEDMLEVFVSGRWSLSARLEGPVDTQEISAKGFAHAAVELYALALK